MDLISIGEAARKLGLAPSALRYYDERGLVRPAARHGGRRMYGHEELRRLAFIQLVQRLGLSLEATAAMLDQSGEPWRETVRGHIAALEELIGWARGAQAFLVQAVDCPAERPTVECPHLIEALDRMVAGTPVEKLAGGE